MDGAAHLPERQVGERSTPADRRKRRNRHIRRWSVYTLLLIAFIVLLAASMVVRSHPHPYPVDLQTTESVQAMQFPPMVVGYLEFVSALNNPIPSIVALIVWVVAFSLFRLFQQALFLATVVGIPAGFNLLDGNFVARPRPSPTDGPIHVDNRIPVHSFPSGHTEHDVTFYGFLLFLSFTEPVRRWRYRWVLIPFQILAALDIVSIGFSRILEGEHWLTDVLAGYLEGALWLVVFIFLYEWATSYLAERRARRQAEKTAQGYKA